MRLSKLCVGITLMRTGRATASGCQPGVNSVLVRLILLGPIALRLKAVPVVPALPASLAGSDDAAAQLQQQLLGGGTGESVVGGEGAVSRFGAVAAGLDHQLFGFSAGQYGVDASGRPRELVFQHGVGAGAGLAHTVFDVGQGAHGELEAVGQVGAVAVAQRDTAAHDVVAEPFQGISLHGPIMTHYGRQCRITTLIFFYLLHIRVESTSVALLLDRP